MTANSRRLGQTCKSLERLASRERKPRNSSSSEPPRSKPDAKDEWPDEGAREQWTMLLVRARRVKTTTAPSRGSRNSLRLQLAEPARAGTPRTRGHELAHAR
jgi:uncharacterized Zn finger protein (UPF0148 family)